MLRFFLPFNFQPLSPTPLTSSYLPALFPFNFQLLTFNLFPSLKLRPKLSYARIMTSPSRLLLIAMSASFALCILGLLLGMLYSLYASFFRHQALESILSRSIPYYKALGILGIAGLLLGGSRT